LAEAGQVFFVTVKSFSLNLPTTHLKVKELIGDTISSLLKNVIEAANARQKQAKKRSLHGVNEHFEFVFNAAVATQIVKQQAVR
jgi:hypothetical protein